MNLKNVSGLVLLALLFNMALLSPAAGQPLPTSPEALRTAVAAALKAKDTNAFTGLFNWQGVSPEMKAETAEEDRELFSRPVVAVKLIPLADDFEPTNELNGLRYMPNVTVLGLVEMDFAEKGNSASQPYGRKGDGYCFAATITEKIPGPITKAKAISIMVMGDATPGAETVVGSCVLVRNGREVTEKIHGQGNVSQMYRADYLKSCTVHKTVTGPDSIQLTVSEDGQDLFTSDEVTNTAPIVYQRK